MRWLGLVLVVLWWGGCGPGGDGPPPTTTTTTVSPAPPSPPAPPPEPPPEPPETSRPQDYIQWTCHQSKPNCEDRFAWGGKVDRAYTVWRGDRDLVALLAFPEYLEGGEHERVDLTRAELELVIAHMVSVNERGDRLIHRIENERHRDFDPNPLGDWHRSQVRKDVANEMIAELEEQTLVYSDIAAAFSVQGCDSIRCWLEAQP